MDNSKGDQYYISKIIGDLDFIIEHTYQLSLAQLEEDEVLVDCVMFRLIQISEKCSKLTDDFKILHSDIPWRSMKGLRNRIVHEYGNVDLSVVYNTLRKDLPELVQQLKNIE